MRRTHITFAIFCLLLFDSQAISENIYSVVTRDQDGIEVSTLIVKDSKTGKKFKGPKDYRVYIKEVRDLNRDGLKDALVATTAGGTCCPDNDYVVTLKKDKLVVVQMEADFMSEKYVKEEDGKAYIVDKRPDQADYYSFDGRHLFFSKTVKGLETLKEVHGPGGVYIDEQPPEVLVFDVNEDKIEEKIVCSVWTRWGSLCCELPLPDGETQVSHTGCWRFGVLASMNNGYHEFVCNFDTIITFDGKRWVDKSSPNGEKF